MFEIRIIHTSDVSEYVIFTYNNYQVGFCGCLQCSPTAPSQLQQMGPPMKALSPRSERIPFFSRLATSSYL